MNKFHQLDHLVQAQIDHSFNDLQTNQVLVFVHGLGGSRDMQLVKDIQSALKISSLSFSFPGHGKSQGQPLFLYKQQTETLEFVLKPLRENHSIFLLGHSKGSALSLMVSQQNDIVISLAGRFDMNQQPGNRYSKEELQIIQSGGIVQKKFGQVTYNIDKTAFQERNEINIGSLCQKVGKNLFIIHGKNDKTVPVADANEMLNHSGGRLFIIDCRDHSDFTFVDLLPVFEELDLL